MAKIIDLNSMCPEDIEFIIGGDSYLLSGNPPTELTVKAFEIQQRSMETKDPKEQIDLLAELITHLFNDLGKGKKKVTKAFIRKNLSIYQMNRIAEIYMDVIRGIEKK